MEYCFLKGFLVALLIQQCISEGLSTSIQSSTVATLQDAQALPQEPDLPPAEVVPVVAPPSLKEVQQAVQEASEQVEGRGAEEVLKELLERVVEAALGQVEGGGEVKAAEVAEQETVEDDLIRAEKGETETEAEVLEQAVLEEVEVEDMGAKGGDHGVGEMQEAEEVDALEDVADKGKVAVRGEAEIATGSVRDAEAGIETGDTEEEGVEITVESPDTKITHGVVEETAAALEETGGHLAVEEAGVDDNGEQAELSEDKGAAEMETQEVGESPAVVEVAVEPEQETVEELDHSLTVAVGEQTGDAWGKKEAPEEVTQVDEKQSDVIVLPLDNYEMETTQTVVGEPVEQEDEEEVNIVKDAGGQVVEDEQGHLAVEGGAAAEETEAEGTDEGVVGGGEIHGESVIKEDSAVMVNERVDQQAGEGEKIALETAHGSEKEDQDALVISAPEPDTTVEQSPENQAPTPSPSPGEVDTQEMILGDKTSDQGNDIITPTDDLLPNDPGEAQPTLDNFVKDALAEPPQAEGEGPGEANELVEDVAGSTETSDLGLEAWKIGAISAGVFLVLETVVIIIYIVKCRNKSSAPSVQRACEEGCVEPEAATGGDCSDDTLPAGNGDTQQIAPLDLSDVASTLTPTKEAHGQEHAIAMSDLPPSSTEESANTGPGPDTTEDLRTSIL